MHQGTYEGRTVYKVCWGKNKRVHEHEPFLNLGAFYRDRTNDLLITSQLLYQLS
jgi:hypothetical protein